MIQSLTIKNIALISELTLELEKGLNILSGETGAGKSIIIDSLCFVLGGAADRSLIRYGETSARVEVVFDCGESFNEIKITLSDAGIDCEDNTVIISRMMTSDKSECRVNGRIVTLSFLRGIVAILVDIHSQNEHQSLLKVSNHLKLLDAYAADVIAPINSYRMLFSEEKRLKTTAREYMDIEERERRLDILNYQIEEIERINCKENEEEELIEERALFNNAQKIINGVNEAQNCIDGYGTGAYTSLKKAISALTSVSKYDNSIEEIIMRLDGAMAEISDISDELKIKSGDRFSSIDINSIEKRLDEIRMVKKKYGKTVAEITEFHDKACAERDFLENAGESAEKVQKELVRVRSELQRAALVLHEKRVKAAESFSKVIQSNLAELGMKNARFEVNIINNATDGDLSGYTSSGSDSVEFMLSPNAGEPIKPLAKIASGGEMSRFMLALKNVISDLDGIGTLIFDEIDTGISGAIATVVACKLYDIARARQVIAITHLPQLASMGDANFLIEKSVTDGKTKTSVTKLDLSKTYAEIMRLSGAAENSAVGLAGAEELKEWANKYKNRAAFIK